jgi:two-component system response regulator AtoC
MKDKVLIIDDSESIRDTLKIYLNKLDLDIILAASGEEGITIFETQNPDLVISDLKMPGMSGLEVLKRIKEKNRDMPVIVFTGYDDMQSTIEAMQLGAYDYLEKPIDSEKFRELVNQALKSKKNNENIALSISDSEEEIEGPEYKLIGRTGPMKEIFKKIGQISSSRVTVLMQGESGTGKELISRIIHNSGITKSKPFQPVNCTAISESLLESEFFGHVKGAFTGAVRDKKGKFELAEDGTIFLDEISEISYDLQSKLLRVIQEREFERVGGETAIPMRARIIAATNKNLAELAEQGKFRADLFYRLQVFTLNIPPLRERKEDIPNLVVHFLKKINLELHKNVRKIPYEVMEMLQEYEWIGNVRELENTLMQAVVLSKGDVLEKENVLLRSNTYLAAANIEKTKMSLAEIEKNHILFILNHCNWDKKKASEILGVSRPTLYNKIAEYNLIPEKK